ncbi:MAG: hypothetical protein KY469_03185 [Actinobacteria bacterium]|nr:hypothetical protein [Actinomycetota bacterium]
MSYRTTPAWTDVVVALRLTDAGDVFDLTFDPIIDDEALDFRTASL